MRVLRPGGWLTRIFDVLERWDDRVTCLARDESGQNVAEYAITFAVVVFVLLFALQIVGAHVTSIWTHTANALESAAG